ncbi:UNVERIFIED_CONTAM: MBL fold metallo-hydrolase, partial [Prevotella sp. 15_C9]
VPTWNGLNTPFLEALTAAGYPPDSIDTVLCTHLHVDHVGWNTRLVDGRWVPTFRDARYLFGRAEYDYWARHRDEAGAPFDDSVQPIVNA